MNDKAREEFEQAGKNLRNLVELLKSLPKPGEMYAIDPDLFDKSLQQWIGYREAYAAQQASSVKGGSMYPMVYAGGLTQCTKEKIESLKKEFEILLRRNKIDI